jgi:teichuronic acid biosynthesis glycosyltransferase TuaG
MLVSCIMPIHSNSLKVAKSAINNIISQDYRPIELIIVDDNSSNEVSSFLKSLHIDIPHRLITNTSNLGISMSTNIAIDSSEGELVALFHDDDYYSPERISKMVKLFKRTRFDIAGSNFITLSDMKKHRLPRSNKLIRASMYFACPISNPSVVFSRRIIDLGLVKYPDNAPAEDYLLWVQLLSNESIQFRNHNNYLLRYSDRESGLDLDTNPKTVSRRKALLEVYNRLFINNGLVLIDSMTLKLIEYFHTFSDMNNDDIILIKDYFKRLTNKDRSNNRLFRNVNRYFTLKQQLSRKLRQLKSSGIKRAKLRDIFYTFKLLINSTILLIPIIIYDRVHSIL